MTSDEQRLNAEWVGLNAFREVIHLASHGDDGKSTYRQSLAMAEDMVPSLYGEDSLIKKSYESDEARKYRQLAAAKTIQGGGTPVSPLDLVKADIAEYQGLLQTARNQERTDQIKKV